MAVVVSSAGVGEIQKFGGVTTSHHQTLTGVRAFVLEDASRPITVYNQAEGITWTVIDSVYATKQQLSIVVQVGAAHPIPQHSDHDSTRLFGARE